MITRRQAGLGAAALAMTPTLVAAQGAPAPTAPAGPGFRRFALGGFTVTVVNDGFARRNIEGLVLNAALFAAFDDVFTPISRALGLAVARQMAGQDI